MMYEARFLGPCANRQGSASPAVSTDALPLHQSLIDTGTNALVGEEHSSGKSGLTLRLHYRNFVPEEQGRHQRHMSIVLARLRHDSALAAALSTHASLAVDGISCTDLKPTNTMPIFEASATEIQGPVLSDDGQGSGFSHAGVGWTARQLRMVSDSGRRAMRLRRRRVGHRITSSRGGHRAIRKSWVGHGGGY